MDTINNKPELRADSLVVEIDLTADRRKAALKNALNTGAGFLLVTPEMVQEMIRFAYEINFTDPGPISAKEVPPLVVENPSLYLAGVAELKRSRKIRISPIPVSELNYPDDAASITEIYNQEGRKLSDEVRVNVIAAIKQLLIKDISEGKFILLVLPPANRDSNQPVITALREKSR